MRDPERLAVVSSLTFWRGDGAFAEWPVVMREGRREVRRAQKDINVAKIVGPGGPYRHASVLVVNELRQRGEVLAGFLEREEQPDMEPERFGHLGWVHVLGPAFNNGRPASGKRVRRVGQQRGDLSGDRGVLVVEDNADAEIPQPGVPRWRQRPRVGARRGAFGPGRDVQ